MTDRELVGAYGLRLSGLGAAGPMLQAAPAGWRSLRIIRRIGVPRHEGVRCWVGRDRAAWLIDNGPGIVVDRAAGSAVLTLPFPLPDAALVHPYLAFPAAVSSQWAGRCALHAGAVAVAGAAWAVVGQKEGGKSSTLAWLARQGHSVVTDDLLVIDQGRALAGPRCLDLREETARRLEVGEALGVIGTRPRFRVPLGPVPAALPLAGWIFLEWTERLSVATIPPSELLRRIYANQALSLQPPDPAAYLDLAALPAWTVGRPRRLSSLEATSQRILDLIGTANTRAAS